jgi:collagenase-like PrtC family protease
MHSRDVEHGRSVHGQPELLAPAGTLRNLRYALAYGADAVYAGMPRYSLRVRNNDFSRLEQLAQGHREAPAPGKALLPGHQRAAPQQQGQNLPGE